MQHLGNALGEFRPRCTAPPLAHCQLLERLEHQNRELEATIRAAERDMSTPKLTIGNKASRLLLTAEQRARELGHRAVGTADVLWAMLNVPEQVQGGGGGGECPLGFCLPLRATAELITTDKKSGTYHD